MSSRGEFVNSGPESGVYTPKPTPQNAEEIPVYLNDELLDLGGRLNNMMEGGILPPQTRLPKRVKEPMIIFFTQPVRDDRGNLVIDSPGVWLYKRGKWWKLIDDPSATNKTLQVYQLVAKTDPSPTKPPKNKWQDADVAPWIYIPSDVDAEHDLWTSVAPNAVTGDNPVVDWSDPVVINQEPEKGDTGEVGYSIEFRYIASTNKPTITNINDKIPVTPTGEEFTITIPPVSHPDKSYVWVTYCYFRDDNERGQWSDPVKFSTPETTVEKNAYAIAKEGYPSFDPQGNPLPGPSWVPSVPDNIPKGWSLWRTTRLEWTDGSPQTQWTTPYRANGEIGNTIETRYIASTSQPDISDILARDPKTSSGEDYLTEFPVTSHPDKSYVWVTTAVINGLDEVEIGWTVPSKFATPDSTKSKTVYALGGIKTFPAFEPTAPGLPGPAWTTTVPEVVNRDQYIWTSQRLEWEDGTPQTNWNYPVKLTGDTGIKVEFRYKASTNLPTLDTSQRIPTGWSLSVPTVSGTENFVWMIQADIDAEDKLIGQWSVPAKYASPESTHYVFSYAKGTDTTYPAFVNNASPNPGTGWSRTVPSVSPGERVWATTRFEFTEDEGITPWETPFLFTGKDGSDGEDGADGNDGLTLVEIFKNAKDKPADLSESERAYPPSGWSKVQTDPAVGESTWVCRSFLRGDPATVTQVYQRYSSVARLTGRDGIAADNNIFAQSNPLNVITEDSVIVNSRLGDWVAYPNVGINRLQRWINPYGSKTLLWEAFGGDSQGGGGGAEIVYPNGNGYFDQRKSYRFSVWVKHNGTMGSGQPTGVSYAGPRGTFLNQSNGTATTNPYFYTSNMGSMSPFKWYLYVGVVHSVDTENGWNSGMTGVYDGETGQKLNSGAEFRFPPAGGNQIGFRYYRFYASDTTKTTHFFDPRVEALDGSQTSLTALIGRMPESKPGVGFFSVAVSNYNGTWPSDAQADAHFMSVAKRRPEVNDVLTLYNPQAPNTSSTRSKSASGAWVAPANTIHGNQLVRGTIIADNIAANTITGDKIVANTITGNKIAANTINGDRIIANTLNGNRIVAGSSISSPVINTGTINGGSININNGQFSVNSSGYMVANNANIRGAVTATSGTFTGTVSGSYISGGSINVSSNFSVNGSGIMTCKGASIGGTLNAVNGTFTGTLSGANGTFKGTVSAGTVTGSTITGGSIRVPASGTAKFSVDTAGNMICNTATVMNPSVTGGSLVGSSIHVPSTSAYKFRVDSAGNVTIRSATSGSRLEISGDQLRVYDGSTLRVVLGRL